MIALRDMLSAEVGTDGVVCRDGMTCFTLADLRSRACAIAGVLERADASRVAICFDDPFDFACVLFAVLAAGREAVIPASSAPGYLSGLAPAYDMLMDEAAMTACMDDRAPAAVSSRSIDAAARITLYTSGSSGAAKPVHKRLAQFEAEIQTLQHEWGHCADGAVTLSSVPHRHIYGLLFGILWPMAAGRAFDRRMSVEPQQLQARIAAYGDTVIVSTPSQLSRWPDLPGFSSLHPAPRMFISSGGPLSGTAAATYAAAFGSAPLEIFGSTETGGIAWRYQDQSAAWQPMSGVQVRGDDDTTLWVRSDHLGHDRWHRTDDTVRFEASGGFMLTGRRDRIVKLDGKRVSLPALEAHIVRHPYIKQAAVTMIEGTSRARIGALAVLSDAGCQTLMAQGRVALVASLRRDLGAYFDAAVLPRHWRFRCAMPFDERGKLPAAAVTRAFVPEPEGFELLAEYHDDAHCYELRVPLTLKHFDGHFPGMPILPGVMQIDWAIRLASREFPAVRTIRSIDRLKFTAPVPPGAVLGLRLVHDPMHRHVRFTFRHGARDCTSGIVVYAEQP